VIHATGVIRCRRGFDLFNATKLAAAKCQILATEPVEHVVIMTIPGASDELVDILVELSE
jgi:hypothetical protein